VIGFDDILDARSHLPPLTTVRHPTFALGYEAVMSLLPTISGRQKTDVVTWCRRDSSSENLVRNESTPFDDALQQFLEWLDAQDEEANAWHAAFSTLRGTVPELLACIPGATQVFADAFIDRARLEIAEQVQRQATDALLRHMDMSNRLGLMTSQLLTLFDATESANVLAYHLPQLSLQHVLVAAYTPHADDPLSQATILLDAGLPTSHVGR
jgi:hypothetical protein